MEGQNHLTSNELRKPIEASADVQQENKDRQETKIGQLKKEADEFLSYLEGPNPDLKTIKSTRRILSSAIDNERLVNWDKDREETAEQGELRTLSEKIDTRVNELFQELFDEEMFVHDDMRPDMSNEKVEINANYSEDKTLLMLGRLGDPIIRGQLARLLYLDKKYNLYTEDVPSPQDIERIMELRVSLVSTSTPITFSGEMPSASHLEDVRENMDVLWRIPQIFGTHGTGQMNMIEAHEKGHSIRKIQSLAAGVHIRRGFNLEKLNISQERTGPLLEYFKKQNPEEADITGENLKEAIVNYLSDPIVSHVDDDDKTRSMSVRPRFNLGRTLSFLCT